MLFPIGVDAPLRRPTLVNHALVVLTLAAFAPEIYFKMRGEDAYHTFINTYRLGPGVGEWWRFITYGLMHDGWLHLMGNMIVLWTFGPLVEDRVGRIGYLLLYVAGLVGAGAAQLAMQKVAVIGASGAVAAVTGAFLVMFPRVNIRTVVFFFVFGVFNIPAVWFIGFAIMKDLFMKGFHGDSGIAHYAHLGGYTIGIVASIVLLATGVVKREPFDMISLFRQAKRRREIKEAVFEAESKRPDRRPPAVQAVVDQCAVVRAEVTAALTRNDRVAAGRAYLRLLDLHGPAAPGGPGVAVMSRRQQIELATHFFESGDHAAAMSAYERFLHAYSKDGEVPHVKLLMGLIAARYLAQPERARTLILDAEHSLHDEEQVALARQLLVELNAVGRT